MNEKKIVIVIEDEKDLLDVISEKLKIEGFEVVACEMAQTALDYLGEGKKADVIWLDYYLKDMDGIAFVGKLKKNREWSQIPVVVVSNSASEEKVNSMLAMGVKKYLLKANHGLSEIVGVVTKLVHEK